MSAMKKKKLIVILIGIFLSVIPTYVKGQQCSQCIDAKDCVENQSEECPDPTETHCFSITVEGEKHWGCTDDDHECKGTNGQCNVCVDDTDCKDIDVITCTLANDAQQKYTRICLREEFCMGTYDDKGKIIKMQCVADEDTCNSEDCRMCEETACSPSIPNCHFCVPSDADDCAKVLPGATTQNCEESAIGCSTEVDKDTGWITRKCMTEAEKTDCDKDESVCIPCNDEQGCNDDEAITCNSSPGGIADVNCFGEKCKAIYNDNGKINEMQCVADEEVCHSNDCRMCEETECLPSIPNCHFCVPSDADDCAKVLPGATTQNCEESAIGCSTEVDKDTGWITRKCMTEAEKTDCDKDESVCIPCNDEQGCNDDEAITCNSSPGGIADVNCFGEKCKAIYNDNGKINEMQCVADEELCHSNDCRMCEETACSPSIPNCHFCVPSDADDCAKVLPGATTQNCEESAIGCSTEVDKDTGWITRKCMTEAEKTDCDKDESVCIPCNDEQGCNDDEAITCNSSPGGIADVNCFGEKCKAIYNDNGKINEMQCVADEEVCHSNDCRMCEETECLPSIPNCHFCVPSDADDCAKVLPGATTQNCEESAIGCSTEVDKDTGWITRKCMTEAEKTDCDKDESVCIPCNDEQGCNDDEAITCNSSPGGIADVNCFGEKCKAIYNDNGKINEMQCVADEEVCHSNDCRMCEETECLPSIPNCHFCVPSDADDCAKVLPGATTQNCEESAIGCSTEVDKDTGWITRKCMTEAEKTDCDKDESVCIPCNDEQGCNDDEAITCNSSPGGIADVNCFGEKCKAIYNDNGKINEMQCVADEEVCHSNDCRMCEETECLPSIPNCHFCVPSDADDCAKVLPGATTQNCEESAIGCSTKVDKTTGWITRKCMTEAKKTDCDKDKSVCIPCNDEEGCNDDEAITCNSSPGGIADVNCFGEKCRAIYNDNGKINEMQCVADEEVCHSNDCRMCEETECLPSIPNCHFCVPSDADDCAKVLPGATTQNCEESAIGCSTEVDKDTGWITRKCMTEAEKTECDEDKSGCIPCNDEEGCNDDEAITCNSSPGGIADVNCFGEKCRAIYNDNGKINEMQCVADEELCHSNDCRMCEETECLPSIPNCHVCVPSDADDCAKVLPGATTQNCEESAIGCSTEVDKDTGWITRKCMTEAEKTDCDKDESVCIPCNDEQGCNDDEAITCNSSPGGIADVNCFGEKCKAIYNDNGKINEMQCVADEEVCHSNDCRMCEETECLPSIPNCHFCVPSDADDCAKVLPGATTQNCEESAIGCSTEVDKDTGWITRKCMTEAEKTDCDKDESVCIPCNDEQGCNDDEAITCNSSPGGIADVNCFGEKCKAIYNDNGKINEMQCVADEELCHSNDCRMCEETECLPSIPNCHFCVPSDADDCAKVLPGATTQNCEESAIGCSTKVDKTTGWITRKCMTEAEKTKCDEYKSVCISCKDEQGCNIHETSVCEAQGNLVDTLHCPEFNDVCSAFYNNDGKLYKMMCKSEMTEECKTNDCQVCKENVCPKEVLRCHDCSSLDKELDCVNHLGNIPSSNCAADVLLCFTRLEEDKVTRGCLQDVSQCNNRDVCRMCVNANDCNNDAVTVCSAQNDVREAIVCTNFDDACQGIYNTDGELTELKCRSSGPCDGDCEHCGGSECKAKLLSCHACDDSDEDSDCFKKPSQTTREVCSISTTECFTNWEYGKGILTRGCLEDDSICKNNADCKTCSGDNCNNTPMDELTKTCKDENGGNELCSEITDSCYGIYNTAGVLTEAGCKNNLQGECNSSLCRECGLDGCEKELRTCIRCNVDDINCTIHPGRFTPIVCQSADSSCYVKQNEEGKNERGCLEFGENCNTNCNSCSDSNCNGNPFPESRRRCYACDGSRTCDEEINATEDDVDSLLKICEKTDDECVTTIIDASRTIRGCRGEVEIEVANCPSGTCKVCAENGCNSEFAIKNPELSCYVCNSTELGCGYALSKFIIKPRPCRGLVLMGNEEYCYHFKKDVIERGCVLELNVSVSEYTDCAAGETCHLCADNDCNDGLISRASLGVISALYLVIITTVITYLT